MSELWGVLLGFVLGIVGTLNGVLLHMRYLDRKLLPPAKPAHKPPGIGGTPV